MNQKIIFFDIDKTLIDDELLGTVPSSAIRAINKVRENGHLAYVNTGRVYGNITPLIKEIGFDGYVCGCGTHVVINGETHLHHSLPHMRCVEIAEKMRVFDLDGIYEERSHTYFDPARADTHMRDMFYKAFKQYGKDCSKTVYDEDFTFDKIFGYHSGSGNIDGIRAFTAGELEYTDRGNHFFELVPVGFTKATGMELVLNHLGISLEDSFAFGDSPNDLPMLRYTPNSIAMGGSTSLYEVVSFITKAVNEDGIEHALKHFSLI